jgi:Tfp pilus assembly protein PilW
LNIIRRGTSIIEIVIAAALISVAIIAALSLTNHSQKQNNFARGLAEATKYNTQAADWLRSQRDILGWATIAATPNNVFCLNSLPADFNSLPTPGACGAATYITGTRYQRQITLTSSAADKANGIVKITIDVTWEEQLTRHTTTEMELTSWY